MLRLGLGTALVVAILDQLTKTLVLAHFAGQALGGEAITPFFSLVLTLNRGMSFGLFNAAAGAGTGVNVLVFSLAATAIVAGLIYWLTRVASPLLAFAIGLIIGGAVGNIIDRIRHGAVVDFLDFHIGTYHWPAFNLADSAICLGVVVMLFESLLLRHAAH
jgi:signal peptidase II